LANFESRTSSKVVDNILLVHGSPASPTDEYLQPKLIKAMFGECDLNRSFIAMGEHSICFNGHTHQPVVFSGLLDDEDLGVNTPNLNKLTASEQAEVDRLFGDDGDDKTEVDISEVEDEEPYFSPAPKLKLRRGTTFELLW
jgi:hypothetical protein